MNKFCKEYVGEIKTLFPIKKKQEKAYIKKLALDVSDYCEEANVTSKQELYDNYGKPFDVVSNYLSTANTDYIVKNLRITKFIRAAIVILLVLAIAATTAYGLYIHHALKVFEFNRIVIVDDTIEENIIEEGIIEEDIIEEEIIE